LPDACSFKLTTRRIVPEGIAKFRYRVFATIFGFVHVLFNLRPRQCRAIGFGKKYRETADKKAAELRDTGFYQLEIINKPLKKAG
jgi:hypothetical protein